jgi:hypothetical protein
MNYLNRFNQGGFSLWWTLWWLQAIFYAWAVASLLGFLLHSKRFSELGNMLSDIFLCIVLLTAAAQGVLRCPSSDDLRPIRHFENGGSGSSGVRV